MIRKMTVSTGTTSTTKVKKLPMTDKKINGKTYYFNEDGEMQIRLV